MSPPQNITHWNATLEGIFPHLSGPQRHGLALWVWGTLLAGSCGLTAVAGVWPAPLKRSFSVLQGQLREWYLDAPDKSGRQRQQIEVTLCFVPLLVWIVALWPRQHRQIALALDATS